VYFKSFDIDDPSDNGRPIDPNGSDGDDNRGCCEFVSPSFVHADIDGNATTEFFTSMQPGDNFKVVASCDVRNVNPLKIEGVTILDEDGNVLPTPKAKITDMLTVWRRLHIEMDSMGNTGLSNVLTGTYSGLGRHRSAKNGEFSILHLLQSTGDKNRYEGGVFCFADDLPTAQCCPLLDDTTCLQNIACFSVTGNVGDQVTIDTNLPADPGQQAFVMVDDDDVDWNRCPDYMQLPDVPAPRYGFLRETDDPDSNVLAPAYITPAYDLGGIDAEQTQFHLNIADESVSALLDTYSFDYAEFEADPDFWTIYLHGAYQYVEGRDGDPDKERNTVLGAATYQGASLFSETISDSSAGAVGPHTITTSHEVGHLVGAIHRDGEVMEPGGFNSYWFSKKSIDKMRWLLSPGASVASIEENNLSGDKSFDWAGRVQLTIETGDDEYLVGQPIDFKLTLKNISKNKSLSARSIDVFDGYLRLLISVDGEQYLEYKGPRWGLRDSSHPTYVTLAGGNRIESEGQILFNEVTVTDGLVEKYRQSVSQNFIISDYAITQAGQYRIKAILTDPDSPHFIESNEPEITVEYPKGIDSQLWNELEAHPEYGYFIQTGSPRGRTDQQESLTLVENLKLLAAQYPQSPYTTHILRALAKYSERQSY
jgi:hypothetical protein